jgi:hemolysin-activating ACP:hemolysin acyltransferase
MSLATETEQRAAAAIAEQLKSLDKTHVGAAMSKLISASIGDAVVVMSKSPAYKFHTLADIEWLVMPAVLTGQIYLAELQHQDTGARAPVAVVTWASVSDDIDQRLRANPTNRIRLLPQEWRSGEHIWIVDVAGEPRAIAESMAHLASSEFIDHRVQVVTKDQSGQATIETLDALLARVKTAQVTP